MDSKLILEKYNELNDLDEVYFVPPSNLEDRNTKNFINHYYKHVLDTVDGIYKMDYMSPADYNNLANELSEAPYEDIKTDENGKLLNKHGVIGYKARNGKMGKYNLDNNLLVIYGPDRALSLYKMNLPKFINKVLNSEKDFGYAGPLN